MARIHELVRQRAAIFQGRVGIVRISGVLLHFGQSGKKEPLFVQQFEQIGKHERGESGLMQQHYVGDLMAERDVLLLSSEPDELGCGFELTLL